MNNKAAAEVKKIGYCQNYQKISVRPSANLPGRSSVPLMFLPLSLDQPFAVRHSSNRYFQVGARKTIVTSLLSKRRPTLDFNDRVCFFA